MSVKITNFIREYMLIFSSILTVIGIILLFLGITGIWFQDIPQAMNISEDILPWSIYILIIGFIVLIAGVIYLYGYLKNRKFILEELNTNKRSELSKKHLEIKQTVKHMPSKYKKMLKEKEKQLRL